MSVFETAIAQAQQGQDLTADQTSELIDIMLSGGADDAAVGQLLLALREKGESVDELVGAAKALRRHMTTIPHRHKLLLDTCGTGGSGSGTFNISTAVAILAAACGVAVAKHGNRRATSLTGSADVLEKLGVPIESDIEAVAERLDRVGICFCFAPKMHPAMRHVGAIRRQLGVRTLFNYLGPLCNPAGATHQLLGTSSPQAHQKIAAAIAQLGTTRSFVIHAADGQDEVSLGCETHVLEVKPTPEKEAPAKGGSDLEITPHCWTPESFGLQRHSLESLYAADPVASAAIIRRVFDGESGPHRDTVLAGAAAALLLVGAADNLKSAVDLAAEKLDSGMAREKLAQLQSEPSST